MNIDSMPAGREMDALVAEKVMGCTLVTCTPTCACYETDVIKRHCGCVTNDHVHWSDEDSVGQVTIKSDPKAYSTDIAAAWEVLNNLLQRGASVRLLGHVKEWLVEFDDEDSKYFTSKIAGETAPLAICRAALKAVRL